MIWRHIYFSAALTALLLWSHEPSIAAPLAPETVTISQPSPAGGKADRIYHILMPPNLKNKERPPAVILLHDAGDDALAAVYRQGWLATAAQARFAIIAPEAGLQRPKRIAGGFFNTRVWNAGSTGAAPWDDVKFLTAVAKDAVKRFNLDADRLNLVGFGEGGSMALRILSAGGAGYNAFASLAGSDYSADAAKTNSKAGLAPLYLLFGGADPTNPSNGGAIITPWTGPATVPGPAAAYERWRRTLGCPETPVQATVKDGIYRNEWRNCKGNAALHAVWVQGLGRQWPGTGAGPLPVRVTGPANDAIFAPWDIWRFFEARRLAK